MFPFAARLRNARHAEHFSPPHQHAHLARVSLAEVRWKTGAMHVCGDLGEQAFKTVQLMRPGIGIVHQVNLEYLAKGVLSQKAEVGGQRSEIFYPDTLVGTDSHTTMINGLGVVGWGVGGIEAEAGMLGQPVYFLTPEVVGVHLSGRLKEGVTATDLVLHIT